jgi:endonuclease/exonuclease/phosphatase family metal-dependent hydrolase
VLDRALDLLESGPREHAGSGTSNRWTVAVFRLASYLTDPVCQCHERYRRIAVVDALHPHARRGANLARKLSLVMDLLGYAALAMVSTAPGIALRSVASRWQKHAYLYCSGKAPEKTLPTDRIFSILSWNVCCVGGGYPITDGGVLPWPARIERIADTIRRQDADVVCLYETFDLRAACHLRDRMLASGYVHCYYNIAPRGLGVNSGILVASKYGLRNPEFTPFPVGTLVGRTKSATKGVFGFDLQSNGHTFARVYSTHLQHSEECMYPTPAERAGRAAQMQIVVGRVDALVRGCTVVTGDLNLDDEEYRASAWQHRFSKQDVYRDPRRTWGGDAFCASLVGKRVSTPLNLDHTMLAAGTGRALRTSLVDPGYDALQFSRDALSDHGALLSEISV